MSDDADLNPLLDPAVSSQVSILRSISAPRLSAVLTDKPHVTQRGPVFPTPKDARSLFDLKTKTIERPEEVKTPFLSSGMWSYSSQSLESFADWHNTELPRVRSNPPMEVQTAKSSAWINAKPFTPSIGTKSDSMSTVTSRDEVEIFLANPYINAAIDTLIRALQPNPQSESLRLSAISSVEDSIKKHLGAKIYPHGSVALKTYLPDSDLNMAAFFTHNHLKTWVQRTMKALQRDFSVGGVQNVSFSETTHVSKVVRGYLQRQLLEVCANQTHALASTVLFEEVDRLVGKSHLFKRTIILVKAWAKYEAKILGYGEGLLNSYTIRSMVLFIFNAFHSEIDTPLQGLWRLMEYVSSFPWEKYAMGLSGPCLLTELPHIVRVVDGPCAWPKGVEPLIPLELVGKYDARSVPVLDAEDLSRQVRTFERRFLNVVDPRDTSNNLGSSLTRQRAGYIRQAFASCVKAFRKLISDWAQHHQHESTIRQIFFNAWQISIAQAEISNFDHVKILDGDLSLLSQQLASAAEFDVPDISEDELVMLIRNVLRENEGAVTVGKMGSLMHASTNNHSLPAMLKAKYGGLKKLLRRHPNVFYIADDHPHNPRVYLRDIGDVKEPHAMSASFSSPHLLADSLIFPPCNSMSVQDLHLMANEVSRESEKPPQFMLCPLSHRLMKDPVVTCDGISYERDAIEHWRLTQGDTCPLTGDKLDLSLLYPNMALLSAIDDFVNGKLSFKR